MLIVEVAAQRAGSRANQCALVRVGAERADQCPAGRTHQRAAVGALAGGCPTADQRDNAEGRE